MDDTGRSDSTQRLVSDFWKGYLTRRGLLATAGALGLSAAAATGLLGAPTVARRWSEAYWRARTSAAKPA